MTATQPESGSKTTYVLVFVGLLVLTLTTVLVAGAPLGNWHAPVALAIAAGKALLIVLFFMHALHGSRLPWLIAASALLGLAIMLGLTWADYGTRRLDDSLRNNPPLPSRMEKGRY
jgi:cytochrome c oxidase subunit 4